ncbi:hypothetical protein CPB83DRAFT_844313 [Crepidotus variabilis]|uniref:BTB domain-containing protein n=1 Tax=Crepidotus variabilis TaxID=179855 RepID=A0A9P6ETE8_9AGAR|nr:hypothetical protein CPB83DRAFT_844313 [Crepidotus variabilis]
MQKRISIGKADNITRGQPWFEDGNIVLLTHENPTAFRLHRGVLGRHSEIFNDMLQMPQPDTLNIQHFEGCPVVVMHDHPTDLSSLVIALYDGPYFANTKIEDFFYLCSILRLSTKYFISNLRRKAAQFLEQTWSSSLKGHDAMVEAALTSPSINGFTYPFVHPLHVLNLARETDVQIVVPSALYFLSLYPLSDILKADHPKLLYEHPSKPASTLSSSDLLLYSLMYQHRLQIMSTFIRNFCTIRVAEPPCSSSTCGKSFSRLVSQLHRSWSLRTGPLHFIAQAIQQVSGDQTICSECRTEFAAEATKLRKQVWDELPSVVLLPSWDQVMRPSSIMAG